MKNKIILGLAVLGFAMLAAPSLATAQCSYGKQYVSSYYAPYYGYSSNYYAPYYGPSYYGGSRARRVLGAAVVAGAAIAISSNNNNRSRSSRSRSRRRD